MSQQAVNEQLFEAVIIKKLEMVEDAVVKGADVNSRCPFQEDLTTPLYHAAWSGNRDIVRLLLSKGADPNAVDILRNSPLHVAAEHGYQDIVMCLIDAGANTGLRNHNNCIPRDCAEKKGHFGIVSVLDRVKQGGQFTGRIEENRRDNKYLQFGD